MWKPVLAVLCLVAVACSYHPGGTQTAPAAAPQAVQWIFIEGADAGGKAIEPPVLVTRPSAQYAEEPRRQRLQGDVGLEVEIDAEGNVVNATVTQPLEPSLDANAVAAVQKWKYSPARVDGIARRSVVKATVQYRVQ
jgi:TonB family protein